HALVRTAPRRRQHHHPRDPRARHRGSRAPHDPHPRRPDRERRAPERLMPFREAIAIAVASLRSNKLRSFLTILGILIGVSSVIAVVAITEGLDRYISDKVLELGTRSFTVQKMPDVITSRDVARDAEAEE